MVTEKAAKSAVDDATVSVPRLYDDDRARRACDVFGFTGDDNVQATAPPSVQTVAHPGA